MALGAGGHFSSGRQLVRVGQRKTRGVVIELAVCPNRDGVACRASRSGGGKIRGDVVRHISAHRLRAVPGRLVATHAIGGRQTVIVADMAGGTRRGRRRHVRANQRKAGDAVVERCRVPPLCGMAIRAVPNGKGGA